MSLLTPDSGLLFWMVIVLRYRVFVLAKIRFSGDHQEWWMSVKNISTVHWWLHVKQMSSWLILKPTGETIMAKAHEEQARILNEAVATRERIMKEAKEQAQIEGDKTLEEVKSQIQAEKDSAISDIRRQVAVLSVDIAEKVLRKNLDDEKEQMAMIDRLLDELTVSKN